MFEVHFLAKLVLSQELNEEPFILSCNFVPSHRWHSSIPKGVLSPSSRNRSHDNNKKFIPLEFDGEGKVYPNPYLWGCFCNSIMLFGSLIKLFSSASIFSRTFFLSQDIQLNPTERSYWPEIMGELIIYLFLRLRCDLKLKTPPVRPFDNWSELWRHYHFPDVIKD